MKDQERLAEIDADRFRNRDGDLTQLLNGDVVWLIQQAERVEGLLEQTGHNFEVNRKLDAENQRYKQALERILDFYPGVPNADFIPVEMLFEIKGIAYRALEGEG